MRSRRPLMLLLIALAIGGAYVYQNGWQMPKLGTTPANGVQTSGSLESRSVALTAEVGGQISELKVSEGAQVAAGDVLAQIDTTLQDTQIARAQAALDLAQAQLAQIKAGPRPEVVQQAQAELDKEAAARDSAQQAVKDVQTIRNSPQDIEAQIVQARSQLETAEKGIPLAETQLRTAQVVADRYKNLTGNDDQIQFQIASAQLRAAEAGLKVAQLTRDGAQQNLEMLQQLRANPLSLTTQVHAALARLDQANASLGIAQAALAVAQTGASAEQIAVGQAAVQQAQAALDGLIAQKDKMTLRAPAAGIVTALPVHRGENVQPGTKLMTIANIDQMLFTLYVPETQIGHVKVGQKLQLTVDGLPERTFDGQIYFIAQQAEYTPRTVQTPEERAKTVFMVKARIANPDHSMKPGMFAEAVVP